MTTTTIVKNEKKNAAIIREREKKQPKNPPITTEGKTAIRKPPWITFQRGGFCLLPRQFENETWANRPNEITPKFQSSSRVVAATPSRCWRPFTFFFHSLSLFSPLYISSFFNILSGGIWKLRLSNLLRATHLFISFPAFRLRSVYMFLRPTSIQPFISH